MVFRAANASVLFESVPIFLMYRSVRGQDGIERSSGPTLGLCQTGSVLEIIKLAFTQK